MRAVEVTLQTDDTGAQTLESPNPSIADGGFPLQVRRSPAFCDDCDSLEASAVFCSGTKRYVHGCILKLSSWGYKVPECQREFFTLKRFLAVSHPTPEGQVSSMISHGGFSSSF